LLYFPKSLQAMPSNQCSMFPSSVLLAAAHSQISVAVVLRSQKSVVKCVLYTNQYVTVLYHYYNLSDNWV
jgi:hypothetical protein